MIGFLWLCSASAEPSIVFVGNSYIQSNNLPRMVSDLAEPIAGWEETSTVSLTAGGLTLADHADRMTDSNSTWFEAFQVNHDMFVFQDQSQIPGFPQGETYWQDSVNGLTSMHEQVSQVQGQSMLMLTWGRRDGDVQNSVLYPDFLAMQERLNDGYLAYASLASTVDNPIYVAPAGPVFEQIYHIDSALFGSLYSGDGSHPSELGSIVAAATLVSSLTGRSVALDAFELPEETTGLVQQAVEQVVLYDAVGTYPLPWVWSQIPEDGRIEAEGMRPLLRIRADQERDLHVVDGRLWLEQGRLAGTTTVDADAEFRILGGSQVGDVHGSVTLIDGRLRLTEVTGDLIQTGGEVWLDQEDTVVSGFAQLAGVYLNSGLSSACLSADTMDTTNLFVLDDLEVEIVDAQTICVERMEFNPTDPESNPPETEDTEDDEKDVTGCAGGLGLWFMLPIIWRRRV